MVDFTEITLKLLQLEGGNEPIEIRKHVTILTSHIMARIEFGCNYEQGILIVELLNQYKQIISAQSTWRSYISKYVINFTYIIIFYQKSKLTQLV